jgi:glyoxylase-like metal-dependent hydrolase (beta-lactamase superfamily II)
LTLRSRHVPGHTAGSTCLVIDGAARPLLFTGDTLFAGGTGRCDQPRAARPRAEASLRDMLETLPAEALVLPGHGGVTTVGEERDRYALSDPTLAA